MYFQRLYIKSVQHYKLLFFNCLHWPRVTKKKKLLPWARYDPRGKGCPYMLQMTMKFHCYCFTHLLRRTQKTACYSRELHWSFDTKLPHLSGFYWKYQEWEVLVLCLYKCISPSLTLRFWLHSVLIYLSPPSLFPMLQGITKMYLGRLTRALLTLNKCWGVPSSIL